MDMIKKGSKHTTELRTEPTPYIVYSIFDKLEGFRHGFSTRVGGVSKGHLASMNLSFSRGDKESNVRENFSKITAAMGICADDMVFSVQTHTTNVRKVTEADRGKGFCQAIDYTDVDGLITNVPGLCLTTFYADCVPLYFIDPVNRAIGLSHSGWKGTVGKIGKRTVEMMSEAYGTNPAELITAIGPSICQDCYEVSEDVIEQFKESFPEYLWERLFYQKQNGKYQLDLWETNKQVLLEAGVDREHIAIPDICTCCNSELMFSHRASNGKRGNLAAFLAITK